MHPCLVIGPCRYQFGLLVQRFSFHSSAREVNNKNDGRSLSDMSKPKRKPHLREHTVRHHAYGRARSSWSGLHLCLLDSRPARLLIACGPRQGA